LKAHLLVYSLFVEKLNLVSAQPTAQSKLLPSTKRCFARGDIPKETIARTPLPDKTQITLRSNFTTYDLSIYENIHYISNASRKNILTKRHANLLCLL
jgi:hypothetical protein